MYQPKPFFSISDLSFAGVLCWRSDLSSGSTGHHARCANNAESFMNSCAIGLITATFGKSQRSFETALSSLRYDLLGAGSFVFACCSTNWFRQSGVEIPNSSSKAAFEADSVNEKGFSLLLTDYYLVNDRDYYSIDRSCT